MIVLAFDGPTPMFTMLTPERPGSLWCQAGIWRPSEPGPLHPGHDRIPAVGISEDDAGSRNRLPRSARRSQLLGAAREVFVAQGYHGAAMDDIVNDLEKLLGESGYHSGEHP